MQLTDTLDHLRCREEARRRAGVERAERIWATVAAAAELLRGRYGATRVAVFGSLVSGDVGPDSDLDLAVEGVTPETYFEALADVMDIAQAGVDLVRLETAAPCPFGNRA